MKPPDLQTETLVTDDHFLHFHVDFEECGENIAS